MRVATTLMSVMMIGGLAATAQAAIEINSFDASYQADGQWFLSDMRFDGTASIVDLTGQGGDLENNQPLPSGAARLTTGFSNGDKAEVAVVNSYGTVSSVINSIDVGYAFYKESVSGGNASAAPTLKIAVSGSHPTDGFVQLIYEPTWNQPGAVGSSSTVPTDTWQFVEIDADNGVFWQTGGFGFSNSFGGPPLKTLREWLTDFDSEFGSAEIIAFSVGVGTYNQGQIGYFDEVSIAGTNADATYDFEAIPSPTAGLAGLGLMGLGLLRRRRA